MWNRQLHISKEHPETPHRPRKGHNSIYTLSNTRSGRRQSDIILLTYRCDVLYSTVGPHIKKKSN